MSFFSKKPKIRPQGLKKRTYSFNPLFLNAGWTINFKDWISIYMVYNSGISCDLSFPDAEAGDATVIATTTQIAADGLPIEQTFDQILGAGNLSAQNNNSNYFYASVWWQFNPVPLITRSMRIISNNAAGGIVAIMVFYVD